MFLVYSFTVGRTIVRTTYNNQIFEVEPGYPRLLKDELETSTVPLSVNAAIYSFKEDKQLYLLEKRTFYVYKFSWNNRLVTEFVRTFSLDDTSENNPFRPLGSNSDPVPQDITAMSIVAVMQTDKGTFVVMLAFSGSKFYHFVSAPVAVGGRWTEKSPIDTPCNVRRNSILSQHLILCLDSNNDVHM